MRISSYELNVNVHVYEGCDENTCLQKSSPRPPSLPSATIFESTPILVTAKSSKTLTLISQLNPSFLLRLFAPSGALSINCIASSLKRDFPGGPLNLKRTILPMAASQPQGQEDSPFLNCDWHNEVMRLYSSECTSSRSLMPRSYRLLRGNFLSSW